VAEAAVRTMVRGLGHRGPDGSGVSVFSGRDASGRTVHGALGHVRLAIIDTSSLGAQPMGGDGDSPTITYNGEVYNFADVRRTLEHDGQVFRSRSDTEVVLRGYQARGVEILPALRGMFAFGLWDHARRRLLIARDRLGIKPLYYYRGDTFFLFASEVRALLATGLVPRRLDVTALWQYLGYQSIPAPRTLVEGVRALEPARWMTVDADGKALQGQYWHMLNGAGAVADASPRERLRRVSEILQDAVVSHLVSDVPVGAFLSGGIDSSAVVALMRESGHTPRTFAVGFDEQRFDESVHARLIADLYRADHTHVQLTGTDLLERLPAALDAMDQPTGDAVNTYVVSGAVRAQGIKVALSGLGGDEVFGGYPSFSRLSRVTDIARIWGRSPTRLRAAAAGAVRAIGGSSVRTGKAAAALESDGSLSSMFPLTRQLLTVGQRAALLAPSLLNRIADRADPYDRLLADAYAAAPHAGVLAQISFAEARTYMHDVLLRDTDQMSMAHALEVRVPLLDHRLVETVMSLPDSAKQPNGTPKRLLVEALDGLLPDSIVNRPKQGFVLPFEDWMRGPLRGLCETRLGDRGLAGRGLFTPDALGHLWQSFVDGRREVTWSRLWTLVVLDSWLDANPLSV
jgi:asparagine synthase (glutamine-hydrolysing)